MLFRKYHSGEIAGETALLTEYLIFYLMKKYHQRSKIETVFSAIKRKYGSVLRNKSFATQQAELISKLITYNLDRKLNYLLLIIEGCTKAHIGSIYKSSSHFHKGMKDIGFPSTIISLS